MVANATPPGILRTGTHSARPAASAVGVGTIYACSTHTKFYQSDGSSWSDFFTAAAVGSSSGQTGSFQAILDGGGAAITTGQYAYIYVPFAITITGVVGLADVSGSGSIEFRVCTYTAFDPTTHPATGDKISASAPLAISSAKKAKDTTLTGWTTAVAADSVLMLVPTGTFTSITRETVSVQYTR